MTPAADARRGAAVTGRHRDRRRARAGRGRLGAWLAEVSGRGVTTLPTAPVLRQMTLSPGTLAALGLGPRELTALAPPVDDSVPRTAAGPGSVPLLTVPRPDGPGSGAHSHATSRAARRAVARGVTLLSRLLPPLVDDYDRLRWSPDDARQRLRAGERLAQRLLAEAGALTDAVQPPAVLHVWDRTVAAWDGGPLRLVPAGWAHVTEPPVPLVEMYGRGAIVLDDLLERRLGALELPALAHGGLPRHIVAAPVVSGERLYGMLAVEVETARSLTPAHRLALRLIAGLLGATLQAGHAEVAWRRLTPASDGVHPARATGPAGGGLTSAVPGGRSTHPAAPGTGALRRARPRTGVIDLRTQTGAIDLRPRTGAIDLRQARRQLPPEPATTQLSLPRPPDRGPDGDTRPAPPTPEPQGSAPQGSAPQGPAPQGPMAQGPAPKGPATDDPAPAPSAPKGPEAAEPAPRVPASTSTAPKGPESSDTDSRDGGTPDAAPSGGASASGPSAASTLPSGDGAGGRDPRDVPVTPSGVLPVLRRDVPASPRAPGDAASTRTPSAP